jgi:hypothetical protein
MTSIQPRAGILLAALAAALCTSPAAAQEATRDSAVPSATNPATTGRARREAPAVRAPRSSRTRLEADVIVPRAAAYGDAFSLIAALRPHWLSSRSPVADVRVYRDDALAGGTDQLRSIDLASVKRIEWLSGLDATTRFGMNHSGGAILVYTRL